MSNSLRMLGAPPATPTSPAILAKGFRPFFLLAAAHGALFVPVWLAVLHGKLEAGGHLVGNVWHAHTMAFGYGAAVLAGFLLTAAGNWTGRETATGASLAGLAALWLAGRWVMATTGSLPPVVVAAVELAFLPALTWALGRAILGAKSRRNYGLLGIVAVLWASDVIIHAAGLGWIDASLARRGIFLAVDLFVVAMTLMAGRVVPMFTRNATGVASIANLPTLDRLAVASVVAVAASNALAPDRALSAAVAAVAALLVSARTLRWGTRHSLATPLLWVLHLGHAFIPLGLAARAAAFWFGPAYSSMALHLHTTGALGLLTVGMMARVALGHTGRALIAPKATTLSFSLVAVAAVARTLVPYGWPSGYHTALWIAGAAWSLGLAAFLVGYARVCATPRVDGKPG